ncbi:MAG: DUF4382 domain-containing protein [Acidobacteria bacterium]|nr:MAG: DUF4382 domain-containing protein [Acidobacteriota bacterium]
MHKYSISIMAIFVAAGLLAGCGGSGALSTTGSSSAAGASPTVVTVGDAPMSSVLAALVTISGVTFTSASGSVSLLQQPRTVELTHLGGIRAPLELKPLAAGTYTSMSITVSAATITYIDPTTGQPVTAKATIPAAAATDTITLNPPLQVSAQGATDVRFDFDLQSSLDLTGSTVTFTPKIGGAATSVESEDDDQRSVHVDGTVSAVDTTANTIAIKAGDSGLNVTLHVTSDTEFDDNVSLATLQVGTQIDTVDRLNVDGSLTALKIEDTDGGTEENQQGDIDGGIVTAVTRDSQNQLTSFTMVIRDSLDFDTLGQTLTVEVNSGTVFKDSMMAQAAGLASYDQSSIFVGQGVWVAGTAVQTASSTVLATEIRPAAVSPFGLTSAAVQAAANGGFTITLLLDNQTSFDKFAGLTTLTVETNASTEFDGNGLTSTTVASLPAGTPLVARGYLAAVSSASGSSDVLFCTFLREESH